MQDANFLKNKKGCSISKQIKKKKKNLAISLFKIYIILFYKISIEFLSLFNLLVLYTILWGGKSDKESKFSKEILLYVIKNQFSMYQVNFLLNFVCNCFQCDFCNDIILYILEFHWWWLCQKLKYIWYQTRKMVQWLSRKK